MNSQTDETNRRRFLWGVLLAWIPFLFVVFPTIIGLFSALREISNQKATGLGAVAGGLGETFSTFGFAAFAVFEAAAIVLLLRAFSRGHPVRAFVSVVSICCSGLMITIMGFFLWVLFLRPPR
jgi:hypothetical protein